LFSLLSFGYIIILSRHLEIWCGSIGFIETGIFCAVVVLMPLCLACVSFELNWIRTFFVLYLFFTRTCLRLRFLHIINHFGFMQISKFFYLPMIPICALRPWCCPEFILVRAYWFVGDLCRVQNCRSLQTCICIMSFLQRRVPAAPLSR